MRDLTGNFTQTNEPEELLISFFISHFILEYNVIFIQIEIR